MLKKRGLALGLGFILGMTFEAIAKAAQREAMYRGWDTQALEIITKEAARTAYGGMQGWRRATQV